MFKRIITVLVMIITPALLLAAPVTFLIENLQHNKGRVIVGIYHEKGFLKAGKEARDCISIGQLENNRARIECDLQPGTYAAAVYHDENSNSEFDINFLGMSKEGYGFTNNPKLKFGPPSFEEASFKVTGKSVEMRIRLTY